MRYTNNSMLFYSIMLLPILATQAVLGLAIGQPLVTRTENYILSVNYTEIKFDVANIFKISRPLNRQLICMSIEFGNTIDFLGDVGKPNNFSRKLLQNIEDRSGIAPILRLGGNTQDKSSFCEECEDTLSSVIEIDPHNPLSSEAVEVIFNKNFFRVMEKNVPASTRYIFGLNYGNNSLQLAKSEMAGAIKYLNQSRIMAYELGNEANVYMARRWRPNTWGIVGYAQQTLEWLTALFKLPAEPPSFQFASFIDRHVADDFTLVQLAKMRIPQNIPGVKYHAIHGYGGDVCTNETAALVTIPKFLNHLETVSFVDAWKGAIEATLSTGAVFHIGETNSAGCHGKDGVSNTFGALLWELDYALTAASYGVDRIFFHNGKGGFYYSMWEPTPVNKSVPAHVNPTYFSMLFVADLVSDLQTPRIAQLIHLDTWELAHFAVFDGGDLKKMVILNTQGYYDSSLPRYSKVLNFLDVLGPSLRVRRLTSSTSASKDGVVWNGQTIDKTGAILGQTKTEAVSDGLVTVLASEAVIVEVAV